MSENGDNIPSGGMAAKALERLRELGEGNGLAPDDLESLLATEETTVLGGQLTLAPRFSTKIKFSGGKAKGGKDARQFPSFAALQQEVDHRRQTFQKGGTWFADAVTEIKNTKDHGWGLQEADVAFPDQDLLFTATETCPSCNGAGLHTCPKCRGQKHTLCPFCHGQKEEECYICFGKGVDPTNPTQRCTLCLGKRFAPCRNCQGTGMVPCPQCQARGGTPCPECKGAGKTTQEVTVNAGATMSFRLTPKQDIPSGLLRMVDRLGVGNLVKGHAEIKMIPVNLEEEKTAVQLEAHIPYGELKLRIHGKPTLVSIFGKRQLLSGVPPFLDTCLKPWRAALTDAATDHGNLEKALGARAIRDALKCVLTGKTDSNDLRRLYPVGLSPETAAEIMANVQKALRNATRKSRVMLAGGVTAAGSGLFAALLLTPLWDMMTGQLPPLAAKAALIIPPVVVLAAASNALTHFTRMMLRRAHPDMPVGAKQKTGWTGYATLAGLLLIYIALVIISGRAGF